eukprot:TRINITY_DN13293_c0_g1_i1.p1 TRINITY_DN13293_c0_g1~~TRINITY_DN13293_c0_g1_i1.p1  ORF type:complete len:570 (+),score=149.52 TRINITY_DN13293_c0_g1_i1:224-1933(+)
MFQDRSGAAEMLEDLFPDEEATTQDYITRNPCLGKVQCGPVASKGGSNTARFVLENRQMAHTEGGWPEGLDCTDTEQTARFRKRVEKEEEYVNAVKTMATTVEHCLKQNNAVDIYEEYFAGTKVEHSTEPPSARNLTVFKDPQKIKRTTTRISWNPDGGKKLACAYSSLQFQQAPEGMSSNSYIWDLNNPNFPELTLVPPSPLVALEYSNRDPNILMGGSYNGLLVFWDLRSGSSPSRMTSIEKSHKDPVYEITWIQSKHHECMSTSTDGQILWWDTRKMNEPTDIYTLDTSNKPDTVMGIQGGTSLGYDVAAGPLKFLVGTEQGYILACDKKSKNPHDRIQNVFAGHHGPIYSLQRHPAFAAKYFLSIGDWTCKVWMQDIKTPIMSTKYEMCYLTDGCWSPTRAGVFFTTKMNGVFDVWDFLYKQNEPTLSIPVGETGLHCMRIEKDQGKLIAFGSLDGSTTLYEISDALCGAQPNEKQTVQAMFERETNREKQLASIDKEKKVKLKKIEMEAKQAAEGGDAADQAASDAKISELESEFFATLGISKTEGNSEGPGPEQDVDPDAQED